METIIQILSSLQPEFFKVSITTVITILIAFQQYQVNKNKLEYDLFEKRLKVFVALQDFLIIISAKLNVLNDNINTQLGDRYHVYLDPLQQAFINYQKVISISEFIFDKDINLYLLEIESEGKELLNMLKNVNNHKFSIKDEETEKLKSQLINRKEWYTDQLSISKLKFIKYLKLKTFN